MQMKDDSFPGTFAAGFRKKQDLRYGENPHQPAAFYAEPLATAASIATAEQLQGKELSYNNIADADTAIECVRQFDTPACVIVKHANPCGAATARARSKRICAPMEADPTSAFGGIIEFNHRSTRIRASAFVEKQFAKWSRRRIIRPMRSRLLARSRMSACCGPAHSAGSRRRPSN